MFFWQVTKNAKFIEGSFSEESDKIGRGLIKILETWQFFLIKLDDDKNFEHQD
jgi:hypothetical protein